MGLRVKLKTEAENYEETVAKLGEKVRSIEKMTSDEIERVKFRHESELKELEHQLEQTRAAKEDTTREIERLQVSLMKAVAQAEDKHNRREQHLRQEKEAALMELEGRLAETDAERRSAQDKAERLANEVAHLHAVRVTVSDLRPTTDDQLESKVAKIGKSVAAVCQFVEIEQHKKAAKEQKKMEKKEAEERAAAERLEAEAKRKKKEEKARRKAEKFEEVNKNLDIKVALRVGELREDVREDVRLEIKEAIGELCRVVARGKQKVSPVDPDHEGNASSSDTDELSQRTRNLCLSEKRKRGPEPFFEGSPPMEQPPK
ncbi:hypothetical protein CBR_g34144 [Chara braunii]|uniref:Uncharacterized protein n=1 Tax=Chara braunii TaxID=69332 RepID=A0A388LI81_CHABU|nr:hypothetical protein CBR_g34144 [Chara braunii]|eukprot:GBG81961.1 hypothetical protein CBR_g34144 [Chara braunii]